VLRAPTPRVREVPPPPSPRARFESTLDAFDTFLAARAEAKAEAKARSSREGSRGAVPRGRGEEGGWDASKLLRDVQGRATIQALLHPPTAPAPAPREPKGKPRWQHTSPTPTLPRTGGRSLIQDDRRWQPL